jgi:hypothetical protein
MGTWAWVIAATDGTHLGDLIGAKSRTLSFPINAPATAKWTSRGDDPGALLTIELATDLMAYRNSQLMFRGRVGATGDDIDANTHKVDWSAVSYRGMLARREIWPTSTKTFTGVDQATIAWTLINDTQALPDGDLGITNGSSATGTTRDRTYEAGKPIGEALDELSQVIGGFDWDISPALEFQLWPAPDYRGATLGWAAVFGDTISRVKRAVDPATFATDLYGTAGDGTTPITRSATSRGPAGRWESTVSWSDVTVQGTLVEHTEASLAEAENLAPSYQLTVAPGTWTPADAWLGDTVRFVCRKGRLNVDTTGRIVQVDITVSDDGDEQAVLTLDRRPVSLVDRLMSTQDRLATLSRR